MRQSPAAPGSTSVVGLLACALGFVAGLLFPGGARAALSEDTVKAAYLYKFVPFITWPAVRSDEPVTICVAGDPSFSDLVDRAVTGISLNGRPIAVRRLAVAGAGPPDCQVLYLDALPADDRSAALHAVHGRPVLTVTAEQSGPKGIINFVVRDNHVRFEIDDAAAAANGLIISSKLLSLAVSVQARK